MSTSSILPTIETLKLQAKNLRADLAATGKPVGHSQSLELVAHNLGYRDWNTLRAASENTPRNDLPKCPVAIGDRVVGRYLGQPFQANVLQATPLEAGSLYRITLHFDEPVDVVTHTSFSSFRQRVSGNIDRTGQSPQKTSNGPPQLWLDLEASR